MRLSGTITTTPEDKTQAPTQTAPTKGTLGTQTAEPTRGQTVRRNIANFFKGIGKAFVSLHNRVQAHAAERKLAANTKSAQNAALHLVKAAGKENPEIRMGLLMPGLLAKAAKLDANDPVGKAMELLQAAETKIPFNQRVPYGTAQWAAMEKTINRVIDHTMGRSKAVTGAMDRSNPGVGVHVTSSTDISDTKAAVKSLLTALQGETDKNAVMYAQNAQKGAVASGLDDSLKALKDAGPFDAKLDCLNDALDAYFQLPSTKATTVLRENSPMTKAIKDVIVTTHPSSKGDLSTALTAALNKADCSSLPDDIFIVHDLPDKTGSKLGNKLIESQVTPEQFEIVTDVAHDLMKTLIGGKMSANIREAADNLPADTVRVLQAIEQKVTTQFPDDDAIAINAFMGTLFLRFQVGDLTMDANNPKVEGRGRAEQAVGKLALALMQTTFNRAGTTTEDTKSSAKFSPETAVAYRAFVAEYADAVKEFRQAVLDRDVA